MTLLAIQWWPCQLYSDDLVSHTVVTLSTIQLWPCQLYSGDLVSHTVVTLSTVQLWPCQLYSGDLVNCTVMTLSTIQWWPCQEDIPHSVHKSLHRHAEWWWSFHHPCYYVNKTLYIQNGDDLSKCHALSNLLPKTLHILALFTWQPHLHQRCCGQTASHPPPLVLVASAQPVSEVKQPCVCYADSNTIWSAELSSGKVFSTISIVFNLYHHQQIQLNATTLPYKHATMPQSVACGVLLLLGWCWVCLVVCVYWWGGGFFVLLLYWPPYWLRFYIAGCVHLGVWFTHAWMLICLKTD